MLVLEIDLIVASKSALFVYCRAAYLCGREPNFELTEAEKQELQLLQWEDFLEQTRQSILSKSTCRWKVILDKVTTYLLSDVV